MAKTIKYIFEIDEKDWEAFKYVIPRTINLDEAVRQAIKTYTELQNKK